MKRIAFVLFVLLFSMVALAQTESRLPIKVYPKLKGYFPFGGYFAYAPHMYPRLAEWMGDTHDERAEKILDDFQRHYFNAIVPANMQGAPRKNNLTFFDMANERGMRAVAYFSVGIHKHMKKPMTQVPMALERWKAIIGQFKDHPATLAYLIFDEPSAKLYEPIIAVHKALRKLDPDHPIIFTHQSRPLNPPKKGHRGLIWHSLAMSPVIFTDCYTMYSNRWGRDPWGYGDVGLYEFRKPNPQAHQWPVAQAFGQKLLPTVEELRVTIFNTLSHGAKGIFLYMPGQAVAPHNYRAQVFPWGDPWFSESPHWRELGRIARLLTTVGPLLVEAEFMPDFSLEVDCKKFEIWTPYPARKKPHWQRPAVNVGVFKRGKVLFLVVHNNDSVAAQKGTVKVPLKLGKVFDLQRLGRAVRPSRPTSLARVRDDRTLVEVNLEPGDGRLFMVGSEKDFSVARDVILKNCYKADRGIMALDRKHLVCSKIATPEVDRILAEVDASAAKGEYGEAVAALPAARRALEKAATAATEYSAACANLDAMRPMFAQMSRWLRAHGYLLNGAERGELPALALYLQQIHEYSRAFSALDNERLKGNGPLIAGDTAALRKKVAVLHRRVLDFRPKNRLSARIAVITDSPRNAEDKAMLDFLAHRFVAVEALAPNVQGLFVNETNESRKLSGTDYDCVWIHYAGGTGRAPFDGMKITGVAASFKDKRIINSVKSFVSDGGALILSGLASSYICDLGLEKNRPDDIYRGYMYRPDRNEPKSKTGLKPVASEKNHTLFKGLDGDGFRLADYVRGQMVFSAVWRKSKPTSGKVLATVWNDASEGPVPNIASVVEYSLGKGKILVVGEGMDFERDIANEFSFRREYPPEGTPFDRFVRNLVEYAR